MIIDSHCHLDFPELQENLAEIILEAKKLDILYLQTICTKISQFSKIKEIAESYDNIFCSIGNHPNNISAEGVISAAEITAYTKYEKLIAIGETGLDYYYDYSPKQMQKESFIEHIKTSQETSLPVIIHTRDAEQDSYDIIKDTQYEKPYPALIHCFTASKNFAKQMLDLGLYISFSGIVTFKNAAELQAIAKMIPLDRILIETDAPYLAPVPKRGKVNQPAYVKYTAQYLAELLNIDFTEFCAITSNNFFNLFQKAQKYRDNV